MLKEKYRFYNKQTDKCDTAVTLVKRLHLHRHTHTPRSEEKKIHPTLRVSTPCVSSVHVSFPVCNHKLKKETSANKQSCLQCHSINQTREVLQEERVREEEGSLVEEEEEEGPHSTW